MAPGRPWPPARRALAPPRPRRPPMTPLDDHPFLSRTAPHAPEALLAQARGCAAPRVALVNAGAPTPAPGPARGLRGGPRRADPAGRPHQDPRRGRGDRLGHLARSAWSPPPATAPPPAPPRWPSRARPTPIMKGQIHTSTFLKGLLPSARGPPGQGRDLRPCLPRHRAGLRPAAPPHRRRAQRRARPRDAAGLPRPRRPPRAALWGSSGPRPASWPPPRT